MKCVDLAEVDVGVGHAVGPAVAVLVQDLFERHVDDLAEVLGARQVAEVVVRVAKHEAWRRGTGCAARMSRPGPLNSSNGLATMRGVADGDRLDLGLQRLVGAGAHVLVHADGAALVAAAGNSCAELAVCTCSAPQLRDSSARAALRSERSIRSSSGCSQPSWRRRIGSMRDGRARRARRAVVCSPPATRATSAPTRAPSSSRFAYVCAPRLRVAHPEIPRRDVARAALQEQALARQAARARRPAQRRGEIGVPVGRLAADARAVAGEAADARRCGAPSAASTRSTCTESSTGVLVVDAIDRDARRRCPAARADPRRAPRVVRAEDGAGDELRQDGGVARVLRVLRRSS